MKKKLEKSNVEEICNLTMTQQGMLFHYLSENKESLYNVQLSLNIKGDLDVDVLKKAFGFVQSENEVLRSVFRWKGISNPLQIILKDCPVDFLFTDLSGMGNSSVESHINDFLLNDKSVKFDLEETPFRINLIKASNKDFVLSLTHHHILYDGWSTGILLKEIFGYYHQLISKTSLKHAAKPKYKLLQNPVQNKKESEKSHDFWKENLKEYEKAFFVPLPPKKNKKGVEKIKTTINLEKFVHFVEKYKVTPASILYTAYGILLQKYLNVSDIVFGTAISSRNTNVSGNDSLMGNFVNTVPFRCKLNGDTSIESAVKLVQEDIINSTRFNSESLYEINRILELKSSENLFDSLLVVENYPLDFEAINVNKSFRIELRSIKEHSDMPLVFTVFLREELEIEITYHRSVFDENQINSLASCFVRILQEITTNPLLKIEDIELLSETEIFQIEHEFNKTEAKLSEAENVIELFEKQVDENPDRTALTIGNEKISYAQLNQKAIAVALKLEEKLQAKQGTIIGLFFNPSVEMIASILGVLKFGGAYVPLLPDAPIERNRYILSDVNADLLLVQDGLLDNAGIKELGWKKRQTIEITKKSILQPPRIFEKRNISANDLIYIIYTSGTTGNPKGVEVMHKGILNFALWRIDNYSLTTEDVTLQLFSYHFDGYASNLYSALLSGGTLVMVSKEDKYNLDFILDVLVCNRITNSVMTPSLYETIVKEISIENAPENLRFIALAGEKASKNVLRSSKEKLPDVKLYNEYGPTEASIGSLCHSELGEKSITILGKPISNTKILILDSFGKLQPIGAIGEICIAGEGLARGYLNLPELTMEKFKETPYVKDSKIYKTGDLGRWLPDGTVEFFGRADDQVKVRGYRVELGEIENRLSTHELIQESVVLLKKNVLVAYYTASENLEKEALKVFLSAKLPEYMVPSTFLYLEKMPLTSNGKINKQKLPEPATEKKDGFVKATNHTEEVLVNLFKEVLGNDELGIYSNFFDVGGDSLKMITLSSRVSKLLKKEVSVTDLFQYTTINSLAGFILNQTDSNKENENHRANRDGSKEKDNIIVERTSDIAVIGMAGRFPNSKNINEYWKNLRNGKDLVTRKEIIEGSNINAKGILEDNDSFDGPFFNYIPSEVEVMDPQIRIFHECVWESLEDAGINPNNNEDIIGLYGGASPNPYFNLKLNADDGSEWVDKWQALTYADKDFLCSRVSYKLNLKGPSLNITTACSTSLVAIVTACDALLANKCNVAIAGGVSVSWHDNNGYVYNENMILSPDGTCRAFDRNAAGTVSGNGAGAVVLKRVEDAVQDGDTIHAVIKGAAMNNDGNRKVGFTAPSIDGQYQVIQSALSMADVPPESIGYIEAHGTATTLGDPIEVAALSKALSSDNKHSCPIGSVKTNMGHLDAAAGVAGFIKTILSLKHKTLVPSLHYTKPNPNIDFENSPFYVNDRLCEWEKSEFPRRAGVSSFGIGGTNAHVILEEPSAGNTSSNSRDYQMLMLSGKNVEALKRNVDNLKNDLRTNKEKNLADIAYTMQVGRAQHEYRKNFTCKSKEDAIEQLSHEIIDETIVPVDLQKGKPNIVFMFSGQGSQYIGMCSELYSTEKYFKETVDKCLQKIYAITGTDFKPIIFDNPKDGEINKLDQIEFAQPALFVVEYAMAKLLMKWGIEPDLMIGHSFGEFVAACVSGVFSLDDALSLVLKRSALLKQSPEGSMLTVMISETDLKPYIENNEEISLAGVNSSERCVVSGTKSAIKKLKAQLYKDGCASKLLRSPYALHSFMLEDLLPDFQKAIEKVQINPPMIPFMSNVTGKLANYEEISSSEYWENHLRGTVRFSDGIENIINQRNSAFIEVGPGNVLSSFVRVNSKLRDVDLVVSTVRHNRQEENDQCYLLSALGELITFGVDLNWVDFYEDEIRKKVSLPTYSFDKIRYKTKGVSNPSKGAKKTIANSKNPSTWFYMKRWKVATPVYYSKDDLSKETTLLFASTGDFFEKIKTKFEENEEVIIKVGIGEKFNQISDTEYELNPNNVNEYQILVESLRKNSKLPNRIVYGWDYNSLKNKNQNIGLLFILRILYKELNNASLQLTLITDNAYAVLGTEKIRNNLPQSVCILKTISGDFPNLLHNYIDISSKEKTGKFQVNQLYSELKHFKNGQTVALKDGKRWIETHDNLIIDEKLKKAPDNLKNQGVYLFIGNHSEFDLLWAEYLLKSLDATVVFLQTNEVVAEKENDFSQYGAKCRFVKCDSLDKPGLNMSIDKIEKEYGDINGVFYLEEIENNFLSILNKETSKSDLTKIRTKITRRLKAFVDLFKNKELDFCVFNFPTNQMFQETQSSWSKYSTHYSENYINTYIQKYHLPRWTSINLNKTHLLEDVEEGCQNEIMGQILRQVIWISSLQRMVISSRSIDEGHLIPLSEKITEIEKKETDQRDRLNEMKTNSSVIEEQMLEIWRNFFGNPRITLNDDFFKLGGDSLRAMKLLGLIEEELKEKVTVKGLFSNSSVIKLCGYIKKAQHSYVKSSQLKLPMVKAEASTLYPLSSVQKRLYFLYELDKSSLEYNIPVFLGLNGNLNITKIKSIFENLIERHESLRTVIAVKNNEPLQFIRENFDFDIEYYGNDIGKDDALKSFIRPFVLDQELLVRVGLVEVKKDEHILMIDTHHIIMDGISQGVLIEDFVELYNNRELEKLNYQYKDFVAWENSSNYLEEKQKQKSFWLNEFSDIPDRIELPIDLNRPLTKSSEAARLRFEIGGLETLHIREMAQESGATMFMVILSMYNILLSKLSGSEDIVVGTPVAGREHSDLEKIVGMFVNTLPLRNSTLGKLGFKEFLNDLKKKTISCFENQYYKFEELVDDLNLERSLNHNPLFNHMFLYRNFENLDMDLPDLKMTSCENEHVSAKVDLSLTVTENTENISFDFEYSTDLFEESTINRFGRYFKKIIADVINNIDIKISDIHVLSTDEQHQLLEDFNNTKALIPNEETVISLFENQVHQNPKRIALISEGVSISYEELDARANRLSHHLLAKGVEEGMLVSVLLDRSIDFAIGVLAVLKISGIYLPIDPNIPDNRINYILDDSKSPCLISKESFLNGRDISVCNKMIYLDSDSKSIQDCSSIPLKMNSCQKHVYVIYTSGSTGQPKGVLGTQKGLMNRLYWGWKHFGYESDEVCCQKTSISFVDHVAEIFSPLLMGVPLVFISKEDVMSVDKMIELIRAEHISRITLVPSLLKEIINNKIRNNFNLDTLRYVFSSGDILTEELAIDFYEEFKNTKLINIYGSSEVSADATYYKVEKNPKRVQSISDNRISIGRPLDNVSIMVLDTNQNLVPIGVPGEIYVSGLGVTSEYLNNPLLSQEKIVQNPYVHNTKMYRTGDLGKWCEDGNVAFLGRIDDQVKIRGFRIEPSEVACNLTKIDGIEDAIVLVKENENEKYLVAYYVSEKEYNIANIKRHLSKNVPSYMLPTRYLHLEKFPLTVSGKIDKRALPIPEFAERADLKAPMSETELKLVEIWAEVLKIKINTIGINNGFFDLGGHSLKAVQLVHMISSVFSVKIELKTIFDFQTIHELSLVIDQMEKEKDCVIPRLEEKEYYRASPAQERMFYKQSMDYKNTAFNISGAFEINGTVDIEKLNSTFSKLLERHEGLRTNFFLTEDYIAQKINKEVDFELEIIHRNDFGSVEEAFKSFIRPFNLSENSLFRAAFLEDGKKKNILFIDIHHIVCDGFSLNLLVRDFKNIYRGKELSPLGLRYVDFAEWQINQNLLYSRQQEFWEKKLSGAFSRLDLPISQDRNTVDIHKSNCKILKVDGELYDKLRQYAQQKGCTDFMLLLAVFYILLNKISENKDIIVGTDVIGRSSSQLKDVLGTFINILPLVVSIDLENSFDVFIEKVKKLVLDSVENQDFQFDQMVSQLWEQDDMKRNPIFDIHFSFANVFDSSSDLKNLEFSPLEMPAQETTEYEFKLEVRAEKDEWNIAFIYSSALYEEDIMEAFMEYYLNILKSIVTNSSQSLDLIDIESNVFELS